MRSHLIIPLLLCSLALPAAAGIPDPASTSRASCEPGALYVTPDGTGPTLQSIGSTITVEVRDANDIPIVGFPFQDIWLGDSGNGDLNVCPGGSRADANTNLDGITTISGAPAAGGWSRDGLAVYLSGIAINGPLLPLEVNSPDINGDRQVNLLDVGEFAVDFSGPVYEFRIDFDHSGQRDIVDLAIFATQVGTECP